MTRDVPDVDGIDAEFLYPSDADVLEITDDDGEIRVRFAVPDPESGEGLVLEAVVERVEEGEFELPLDDERYD